MKKMLKKSKGFTLVELLIVIIIIGILAGMMMLATGAATDKAEATKIVANMRSIKAAAVMYYADNNAWPTVTFTDNGTSSLDEYLDQKPGAGYKVVNSSTAYAVSYGGTDSKIATANGGINKKLADMAANSGLYNGVSSDTKYTADGMTVYMPLNKQ